jgi:hypothetical protein
LEQSSFADASDSDSESEGEDEEEPKVSPEAALSSPSYKSVPEVLEELRRGVQRLNDLNASLNCPVLDFDFEVVEKPISTITEVPSHQTFAHCIQELFQDASDTLVDYFGRVNWDRYQHLQKLRTANEDAVAINVSSVKTKYYGSKGGDSGYVTGPKAPSDAWTAAPVSSSALSAAPTVISSRFSSRTGGGRSRYPKLPEEAKRGDLFECAACGRFIKATCEHEYR